MVSPITGELVVTSASSLRWRARILFVVLFIVGIAIGYGLFKLEATESHSARLDARFVELNATYNKRIAQLTRLITQFEKEFATGRPGIYSPQQQKKLEDYLSRLIEYRRSVEVELIAFKIRLLAAYTKPEYAFVLADSIQAWAEPYGHDPNMLIALIHAESGFKNKPDSSRGGLGLTQVREEWVQCNYPKLVCNELRFLNSKEELAENDDKNIRAGSAILNYMLKQANGKWGKALALYQKGSAKVDAKKVKDDVEFDDSGVKKILKLYQRLKLKELKEAE